MRSRSRNAPDARRIPIGLARAHLLHAVPRFSVPTERLPHDLLQPNAERSPHSPDARSLPSPGVLRFARNTLSGFVAVRRLACVGCGLVGVPGLELMGCCGVPGRTLSTAEPHSPATAAERHRGGSGPVRPWETGAAARSACRARTGPPSQAGWASGVPAVRPTPCRLHHRPSSRRGRIRANWDGANRPQRKAGRG